MKNIIYILGLLLIMGSCSDDGSPLSPDSKGVPARVSLRTIEMKAATRSTTPLSPEYENKVVHLWVLQFAYSSDGSGTLLRKEGLAVTDQLDIEITLTPNTSGQQSKLYFVANMEKATFPEVGGMTETQFKTKVTDQIGSEGGFLLQNTTESGRYIPMFGEVKDPVSVGADGLVTQLNVSLVRMLARVDVIYKVSDGSNFTLRSIRACNIPNKISYYRSTDASGIPVYESAEESPVISNASQDLQDFAYEGSVNSSSTPTTLTFYLPPNHRGLGDNLDPNKDEKLKTGKTFASYILFKGFSSKSGNELIYTYYPGKDSYNDYNIDRNTHYTLTSTIEGASLSDPRISVLPSSNCYMVAPGDSVDIPLDRFYQGQKVFYGDYTPFTNLASRDLAPSVVWQTAPGLVSLITPEASAKKGFITVKIPSNSPEGNAVVQIKDNALNTVFWSWHIWVTSYKPDRVTPNGPNNNVFMDRNLGATTNILPVYNNWVSGETRTDVGSFGLFYQWGRKDPFLGLKSIYINYDLKAASGVINVPYNALGNPLAMVKGDTVPNGLEMSVKNPFVFYKGSKNNNSDWYSYTPGKVDNSLWGVVKTIYDPCPSGWRVPNEETFYGSPSFSPTSPGFIGSVFNSTLSFPAAGYLFSDGGVIPPMSAGGIYWFSNRINNNSGWTVSFGSSSLGFANRYKALGLSVRCVKE